jgi:hypothetical protein
VVVDSVLEFLNLIFLPVVRFTEHIDLFFHLLLFLNKKGALSLQFFLMLVDHLLDDLFLLVLSLAGEPLLLLQKLFELF